MNELVKQYEMTVAWSEEDLAFIARVPAWRYVSAHGDTPEEALAELQIALEATIETHKESGYPIPAPDRAINEIRRFAGVLNVSGLARKAGLNKHTLATKLKRGTPFTEAEAKAISRALAV